jgi:hypothetical protein
VKMIVGHHGLLHAPSDNAEADDSGPQHLFPCGRDRSRRSFTEEIATTAPCDR